MEAPAQDIAIDGELVSALLHAQHPDLAELPLTAAGAGWDNSLWRLGPELLVRLPRRQEAVELMAKEQRWLPTVAAHLPLPVPVPVRVGEPSALFPRPWSVVRWIDGTTAALTPPVDSRAAGRVLGTFLRALHRPAPAHAPVSLFRGVPLVGRAASMEERLAQAPAALPKDRIRSLWKQALAAPPFPGPAVWVHGDLHSLNILVHEGRIAAVIDFGDLCAGDPASDLACLWMVLPAGGREAFAEAYGGLDPATQARGLGWALLFGMLFSSIPDAGRGSLHAVGTHLLTAVLGVE